MPCVMPCGPHFYFKRGGEGDHTSYMVVLPSNLHYRVALAGFVERGAKVRSCMLGARMHKYSKQHSCNSVLLQKSSSIIKYNEHLNIVQLFPT